MLLGCCVRRVLASKAKLVRRHCIRCLCVTAQNQRHDSKLGHKEQDLSRIRNIGIIAHIDAGKTTTTERFLYYSGLTSTLGEVHDGDTVMDYMVQERERGITITSAAVTFPWKKHRVNLMDTPGHVDFTVEVERSLSVLDGAVVVLDAAAGVEAQTVTVWTQADRYSLPRIAYLNKMDKATADVDLCLKSMARLGSNPFLIHLPLRSKNGQFEGLVDIVDMKKYIWRRDTNSDGSDFSVLQFDDQDTKIIESATKLREELIGNLSDFDEQLSEAVLSSDSLGLVPSATVINALRRATIRRQILPVMVGSSYKNVGVQLLMDNVLRLLPSPLEVNTNAAGKYYKGHFCGLAFKVIHDKMLGALTFIRIYSGELKTSARLFNVNRNSSEKCSKLYMATANEYREVASCGTGNIVVVAGLSQCITGDTLVASPDVADMAKKLFIDQQDQVDDDQVDCSAPVLVGPRVPDPVFFCSIEAPSVSKQRPLEEALVRLQREDPSLHVKVEEDSGQMVLSGMGELHIEIIKDRLLKEYGIEAYMGPLQVSYRETISATATETTNFEKVIGGSKNHVDITMTVKPSAKISSNLKPKLKVIVTQENDLGKIRLDRLKAIEQGMAAALEHGPLLNFPVIGVDMELHWFKATYATSPAVISAAASTCVAAALRTANLALLEPLMKLEITVPGSYGGRVISDLSSRRAQLGEFAERPGGLRVINAIVPLSELVNYSTTLRTLCSGTSGLSMEFDSYARMSDAQQNLAYQRVTGFAV